MGKKRKKKKALPPLTQDEIVNWWLRKYHKTTVEEQIALHPEYAEDSRIFYERFPIHQFQHDQWREWLLNRLSKDRRFKGHSKSYIEQSVLPWIYLDTAPMIIEEQRKRDNEQR